MEGNSIVIQLIVQLILISLNAIFACAEIAVISINDNKVAKLAEKGDKKAVRLARLTNQPAKFLATIQVAITLSGFLGSAFAADNFSDRLTRLICGSGIEIPPETVDTISVIVITLILSYFTLVFGELVPKRLAMKKAESIAMMLSALITFVSKIFAPVVWLLTASTNLILRIFGINPHEEDDDVSEEEIRLLVDAGSEKGTIAKDAQEIIENVFRFDDINAGQIATHRRNVIMLWLEESDEEWEKTIYDTNFSLFPVCGETADDVVGILSAKDYFRLNDKSRDSVMANTVKPVYFVPETVKADILFKNMKKTKNRMAVVLDEYGGMHGIITINDLIEELVGNLYYNPYDNSSPYIESMDDGSWKLNGSVALIDVCDLLNVDLPVEDYDTFAGLIFGTMGAVPEDGTVFEIDIFDLNVKITEIKNHEIKCAYVKKLNSPSLK